MGRLIQLLPTPSSTRSTSRSPAPREARFARMPAGATHKGASPCLRRRMTIRRSRWDTGRGSRNANSLSRPDSSHLLSFTDGGVVRLGDLKLAGVLVREFAAVGNRLLRIILHTHNQGMEYPLNRPKGLMTPAA